MVGKSKFQVSRFLDEKIKRIVRGFCDQESELAKGEGPLFILGFNYGNVTNCVALTQNYKLNHSVFPVVGLIFPKQSPTENDIKGIIRTVKQYASPPNGLGSFKKDKNEHLFLIYNLEEKTDEVEKRIFNITKGCFVRRKRLRLNIIDDPYYPRQFPRVSEDLFTWEDAESMDGGEEDQVDHLFFFVHGVGGICDVRFRSCVEVVADFKKMANELLANQSSSTTTRTPTPLSSNGKPSLQETKIGKLLRKNSQNSSSESHLSDVTDTSNTTQTTRAPRVECLPVSWHSCTRRQTGINDQLNLIALNSVPTLRKLLNTVVLDALLYSSGPAYCQTIINNVGDEINRLYSIFMEKHPNFNGSVSLVGHSLGSVIVFDLLANQIRQQVEENIENLRCNNNNNNNNNSDGASDQHFDTKTPSCDETSGHSADSKSREKIKTTKEPIESVVESLNSEKQTFIPENHNCGIVSHHHNILRGFDSKSDCTDYKNLDELLKDMDLLKFSAIFQREHLDLQSILLLTDIDMKELKLPLGARRKLGNYINFKKISLVASGMRHNESANNNNNDISNTKFLVEKTIMDNMKTGQYLLKYPQLKFKPKCFFAFGSPMPMFLNIRGVTEIGKSYRLPTCDRVFNVFHPYDPLAYRVEPLIDPRYKELEPILVPHHRGGKRIHVQLREGFSRVSTDIREKVMGSIRGTWTSFTRYTLPDRTSSAATSSSNSLAMKNASSDVEVEIDCNSGEKINSKLRKQLKRQQEISRSLSDYEMLKGSAEKKRALNSGMRQYSHIETDTDARVLMEGMSLAEEEDTINILGGTNDSDAITDDAEHNSGKTALLEDKLSESMSSDSYGQLNQGERIDYVLQEKPIELFNEYLFCFTSHANYWQNEDSALFMLKEIYKGENVTFD